MRTPYAVILIFALMLGGTYWYTQVDAMCSLPLSYRIGTVDERFELSYDEARIALMEAEATWENATGQNLFRYDDEATFTINFVYDDRQALANAEEDLRQRLNETEDLNTAIDQTYAELVAEYNNLNIRYQDRVEAYEQDLNAYNAEVAAYNEAGGAPEAEYERLNRVKRALDEEQEAINTLAARLNGLVAEINRIGEEGNRLVDIHNRHVEVYNDVFADEREFTQGDYRRKTINIYTFSDRTELVLVLAHELGHAIALDHVENEESIMYYLIGGQSEDLTPTAEDLAAFDQICGERSTYDRYLSLKSRIAEWFE